jgi:hypothetical protein
LDIFHLDQQQLGRPVGHMPSPPSVGHPGLPESDHVNGIPMNYIHNSYEGALFLLFYAWYVVVMYFFGHCLVAYFVVFGLHSDSFGYVVPLGPVPACAAWIFGFHFSLYIQFCD